MSFSATGGGGGSGAGGAGGGGALAPLAPGGASKSRNTRLDVFRFPDFETSSRSSPLGLGGGGGVTRDDDARFPGSPPYILSCSVSISRRFALSGEISVNSFRAEKA